MSDIQIDIFLLQIIILWQKCKTVPFLFATGVGPI